jgi:intracellular sulfur oxidation DsrE/DsrF family protein
MEHDLNQAKECLSLLTREENPSVTLQIFYDVDNSKPELAKTFKSTLIDALPLIEWSQKHYCGIFVALNEFEGDTRSNDLVTGFRGLFADCDGMEEPEWALMPHFTQQRDSTHSHAIWLVDDIQSGDEFRALQKRIAIYYGTDEAVCDPARVFRLAGFNHYKDPLKPAQYSITNDNTHGDYKYTADRIVKAHPLTAKQDAKLDAWVEKRKVKVTGTGYENNEMYNTQFKNMLTNTAPVAIQGSGSSTVIKVASRAHDYGIPLEVCQDLMWNHYNQRCLPPWLESERNQLNAIIGDAYRYAKSPAGCKTATACFSARGGVPEPIGGWEANNALRPKTINIDAVVTSQGVITPITKNDKRVVTLIGSINNLIKKELGAEIEIECSVINSMLSSCFYSSQKSSYFLLSENDDLLEAKNNDVWGFLVKTFGSPFCAESLRDLIKDDCNKKHLTKTETNKRTDSLLKIPSDRIKEHLRYYNQKNNINMDVDMFADKGRIEIHDEHAQIFFRHTHLEQGRYDSIVINDFVDHFKQFDEWISWLVDCRFASDRKLGYLWLHADSDFGKGFLISILSDFRLCVDLSVKEIEKMFEGTPVGRSEKDFKRAIVISIDEFKSVKSELKQLQNHVTISPKNQLSVEVSLYAKLFTSAEHVSSLVGDAGIEDQFANRFSYFRCKGSLNHRELFKEVGKAIYFNSVKYYFAEKFNHLVREYISLGKAASETIADNRLIEFHNKHGIRNEFNVLSESLPEIANEITQHCIKCNHSSIVRNNEEVYLTSPVKIIEQYIDNNYDHSNKTMMLIKKTEIRDLMCVDNKGCITRLVNSGERIKAIKIK